MDDIESLANITNEPLVRGNPGTKSDYQERGVPGFLSSLFLGLVRDAVKIIIAFAVGTGAGAIICRQYGISLVFSLLGSVLVLGSALALSTDSLISE